MDGARSTSPISSGGVPLTRMGPSAAQQTACQITINNLGVALCKQAHKEHKLETRSKEKPASTFEHEKKLIEALLGKGSSLGTLEQRNKLYHFCHLMRKEAQALVQKAAFNQQRVTSEIVDEGTKQDIAKVLYIAERDIEKACEIIVEGNYEKSKLNIDKAFREEAAKVKAELSAIRMAHSRVPLQSPEMALCIALPREIAKMLLTSDSRLNTGLVQPIIDEFLNGDLLDSEKQLAETLQELARSEVMQQEIAKAVKPKEGALPAKEIVQVTLGWQQGFDITDHDAKVVILAARLSHMRQGDVGNCFDAVVEIRKMEPLSEEESLKLHSALRNEAITDLAQLVEQGKLTRSVSGGQREFVPVLNIGDSCLSDPIRIKKDGTFDSCTVPIWEAPGIKAAAFQIGIESGKVEEAVKFAILALPWKEEDESVEATPEKILKGLVRYVAQQNTTLKKEDLRDLKHRAFYAFSAQNNSPLLNALQSCDAAASEAKSSKSSLVRKRIESSISAVLKPLLPAQGYISRAYYGENKIMGDLPKTLDSRIQMRYDERVSLPAESGDGHSEFGAFVLHKQKEGKSSLTAKPVRNPEDFQKFVAGSLKTLEHRYAQDAHHLKTAREMREFVAAPSEDGKGFLGQVFREYAKSYGDNEDLLKEEDLLKVWKQLQHLPFRDAVGNDSENVLANTAGIEELEPEQYNPKNAQELLQFFIKFGRSHNDSMPRFVENEVHAFSLIFNDPKAKDALKSTLKPEEWVEKEIVAPGLLVADAGISAEMKEAFITEVAKELPKEVEAKFRETARSLTEETVSSYGNALAEAAARLLPKSDQASIAAFQRRISGILINKVLPQEEKKKVFDAAFRIADSNWVDTKLDENIYFVCYLDPLTKAVQFGCVDEKNRYLRQLSSEEWLPHWTMFGANI